MLRAPNNKHTRIVAFGQMAWARSANWQTELCELVWFAYQ
jgi:hypothetical protein